ncbi:hypothetical protein [Polaribacter septentrionalilitoris]|uniref:hypothetical protein n=1 Tax=Polaribacter septentrionalilitoris TaxID=2494657 RepID=UPI00135A8CA6|nr:hypothetical protein [Polaribacter septentrionalilitoris]
MKAKAIDILIIFVLFIISNIYFLLKIHTVTILFGCLVFLLPPIIYLSFRKKKDWLKILIIATVIGVIIGVPFTFLGELTNAWIIHDKKFRFFDSFYLPVILGWMLMSSLTIIIYQHFYFTNAKIKTLSKRFKKVFFTLSFISVILILTCFIYPNLYPKQYSYAYIGIINIIPFLYYLIKRPKFILKITPIIIYFFSVYFSMEYIGLTNNLWSFKGSYIGEVSFFKITFPTEELVYWMILFSPSVLCFYNSFVIDNE